jgi:hypothetical protein
MTDGPILDRPQYSGIPGPHEFGLKLGRRPSKWHGIVAQVRKDAVYLMENGRESQWAVVALYTKGGREQTWRDRARDRQALGDYLHKKYPLEIWNMRHRTIPDTHYHRQLLLRFGGFMTEEESAAYWQRRRESQQRRFRKRSEAAKAAANRKAQVIEDEVAAMRERAIRARGGRIG